AFDFPNPEALPPPVISMEATEVGYEKGNPILSELDLRIDMDDRIALLGQNGNGKSTFAKLLSGKLTPMEGEIVRSRKLNIGYFAQHQQDELDRDGTPITHLAELMKGATETQVRARLGGFGFGVDKASNKISTLSGGEKARLLFALMSFHAPQMIILDEPTNHLDMDSRQSLIHAINEYEGAVIIISHDSYLVEACADKIMVVNHGTVKDFDGDIKDYKNEVLSSKSATRKKDKEEKKEKKEKKEDVAENTNKKAKKKISGGEKTQLLDKIKEAERRVDYLNKEVAKYTKALSNPKLYVQGNPAAKRALAQFTREKKDIEAKLDVAEHRWMELEERLNQ
ncbi:MAG: ABC-F family ATP-binding cassette domain-containing protein, partial [Kordiimonadaceae bacterium]|nr:ABC-F family ATP-binding cassette domain-containing protein [Kordiimonadaceae bacterium]